MERLLDVITILSVLLAVFVLLAVRREHIRVEYSVSWLATALILAVLARSQRLLDWLSEALGISGAGQAAAPLTLLVVAGALFLMVLYRLSLRISNLKDSNIALTQRLAILEFRLETLGDKSQAQ